MKTYLDHAASTWMAPTVADTLDHLFRTGVGNASSAHTVGSEAAARVSLARERLARRLGTKPGEVAFTSGGTESNNWVLQRVVSDYTRATGKKPHLITSSIEHSSVVRVAEWLAQSGFADWDQAPVDREGFVDQGALKRLIRPSTALMSIVHGNNEIGTLQDLTAIGTLCRQNDVLFHSDVCQSFGHAEFNLGALPVDFASVSGHKICGPKGIGALFIRSGLELSPLMFGGAQESGRRPGTSPVELMEAFAMAAELWGPAERSRLHRLREAAAEKVRVVAARAKLDLTFNGTLDPARSLGHVLSFTLPERSSVEIGKRLSAEGLYCSNGSACTSGKKLASPILMALGRSEADAHQVRISFGLSSKPEDLERFADRLSHVLTT